MDFYGKLQEILALDAGGRGLHGHVERDMEGLSRTLSSAEKALIITGFSVFCPDGRVIGETDGPVGSTELARALTGLGCETVVATDVFSYGLVSAALKAGAPNARAVCIPMEGAEAFARQLFDEEKPQVVISLERPGQAADGHCHNMRGRIIDAAAADADALFALAKERRIPTVGIGDGGNELGMGAVKALVEAGVPNGDQIAAVQTADYTLVAGVSNWWGFGLAGLLQYETGKDLIPDKELETEILRAVVEAGGVDGCTAKQEMTVDRLPLSTHLGQLEAVRELVTECEWEKERERVCA